MIAAEDYTGESPNVTPARHGAALSAQHTTRSRHGYEVEIYNVDTRPPTAARQTRSRAADQVPDRPRGARALRRVDYYTGDDFAPNWSASIRARHRSRRHVSDGRTEMAVGTPHDAGAPRLQNEGGKVLVDGRSDAPDDDSAAPACRPPARGLDAGQAVRLLLPGRTTRATTTRGHGVPALARQFERHVAELLRRVGTGGIGARPASDERIANAPVASKTGGLFDGMGPIAVDRRRGTTRTRRRRQPPDAKIPSGCALDQSRPTSRCARDGAGRLHDHSCTANNGGAIVSTRDRRDLASASSRSRGARKELVKRSLAYLLPTTPDTTPPTIVGLEVPADDSRRPVRPGRG